MRARVRICGNDGGKTWASDLVLIVYVILLNGGGTISSMVSSEAEEAGRNGAVDSF